MDCIGYRFLHVAAVNSISSSQYQLPLHPQALLRKSITQANSKSTLLHTIYIYIYILLYFSETSPLSKSAINGDRRLRFQRLALPHCCNSANKYPPPLSPLFNHEYLSTLWQLTTSPPFPSPPPTFPQPSQLCPFPFAIAP